MRAQLTSFPNPIHIDGAKRKIPRKSMYRYRKEALLRAYSLSRNRPCQCDQTNQPTAATRATPITASN